MQVFGEQEVEIANLVCSDGFEARLQTADVREKAASIGQVGLIHPPLVRASDGRVGPGEDRIAACCLLGWSSITVRLIECSDDELEALREHENRVRRKESGAELLEMVTSVELAGPLPVDFAIEPGSIQAHPDAQLEGVAPFEAEDYFFPPAMSAAMSAPLESTPVEPAEALRALRDAHAGVIESEDPGDPPAQGGRPRGKRGKAIAKVAEQTGRSPEAVRKALEREAKRIEKLAIETWGREQDPEWMKRVVEQREELTLAADKLKAATSGLTRLATLGIDMLDRREEIRALRRALRDARPACVCAWCKNLAELVEKCTACKGLGWIPESLAAQIPEQLKDPRAVMVHGDLILQEARTEVAAYDEGPVYYDPEKHAAMTERMRDGGYEIPGPDHEAGDYDVARRELEDEEDIGL